MEFDVKRFFLFVLCASFLAYNGLLDARPQNDGVNNGGKKAPASSAIKKPTKIDWKGMMGDAKGQLVDKGLELASKAIDKQFEIWYNQSERPGKFLKKKFDLNIWPGKGFRTPNMFAPSGYKIEAEESSGKPKPASATEPSPHAYPGNFIGTAIMNGCWGKNYAPTDPCYNALEKTKQCRNMIDGAAFIGVGFDGRGEYSSESRRMSIIQRNCAGKGSYGELQVPDTMNVHGIYDTEAVMHVYESRSEYQQYLQQEAGISGSFFGFFAGVKKAWGSSSSSNMQSFLATFDINIDRFEIFKDEVKPSDLSVNFLREFLNLPQSYFTPKAPIVYQSFIQRWGTHYIKSAKFGGQLQFRKTLMGSAFASKQEAAEEAETDYKSLFWSIGTSSSKKSSSESRSESKSSSTSIATQGGDQQIAAVLADMYSPSFKGDLTQWLESIQDYPKPYKFTMGSITDLLDFRAQDLFPDKAFGKQKGCEQKSKLKFSITKLKHYYERTEKNGVKTKVYCDFDTREEVEKFIRDRRQSLMRAIEIYMDEGPISVSDFDLPSSGPNCEAIKKSATAPTWADIKAGNEVLVTFQMENKLKGVFSDIDKDMSRIVKWKNNRWFTEDENGGCHLYSAFKNGQSSDAANKKMSFNGLVLKYETTGNLKLDTTADVATSALYFPGATQLEGKVLATVSKTGSDRFSNTAGSIKLGGLAPCNVKWSNAMRLDPSSNGGKCLHFTATSAGSIFAVFAGVPSHTETWYYVEIATEAVGIYKDKTLKASTFKTEALGLGDDVLYQTYFVCIKQVTKSVLIEYGKSDSIRDAGTVYLTWIDIDDPYDIRFYTFGNADKKAQIADANVISRSDTKAKCDPQKTMYDELQNVCTTKCHEACDPLAGCKTDKNAAHCYRCRYANDPAVTSTPSTPSAVPKTVACLAKCPPNQTPNGEKICTETKQLNFTNPSTNPPAEISGVDLLREFSFCGWVKLNYKPINGDYEIFKYIHPGEAKPVYRLSMTRTGTKVTMSFSVEGSKMTIKLDNDLQWHRICITRNSASGVVTIYKDKKRVASNDKQISDKTIAKGEGKLNIGLTSSLKVSVSDMNFWNRILDSDDMRPMFKSCGQVAGDAKGGDWFAIMTAIRRALGSNKRKRDLPGNEGGSEGIENGELSGEYNSEHGQYMPQDSGDRDRVTANQSYARGQTWSGEQADARPSARPINIYNNTYPSAKNLDGSIGYFADGDTASAGTVSRSQERSATGNAGTTSVTKVKLEANTCTPSAAVSD